MENSMVTLEKHFQNSRCSPQISVELIDSRRMEIQKRIGSKVGNQRTQMVPCPYAVTYSGKTAGRPCPAPAGMTSPCVEPVFQRFDSRVKQFRGAVGSKKITRIETVEMGNMPMTGFCFLKIFVPLKQCAVLAYFKLRKIVSD